jgi:hypothetical protein
MDPFNSLFIFIYLCLYCIGHGLVQKDAVSYRSPWMSCCCSHDYSSPIPLNFWDCFVFCCSLELVNLIRSIVAKSPQGTVFLSIAHLSPVFRTRFECVKWMILLATYLNVVCGWWAFIQGVLMTPSQPALAWLPNAVNVC